MKIGILFYFHEHKSSSHCGLTPHACRQILSSRRGLFEGLRTDAAEVTVAPGPVVEHFNVIEDIRPGQIPGFVYSLPDAFFFQ